MNISKSDALAWFSFFAELPEDEELTARQQEIVYAVFAQIEAAVERQNSALMAAIPGLKTLEGRTYFVGEDSRFPQGCRSCLLGTGLSAVRRTNRCNLECPFCYNYGELDSIAPVGEGLWETRYYVEEGLPLLVMSRGKYSKFKQLWLEGKPSST